MHNCIINITYICEYICILLRILHVHESCCTECTGLQQVVVTHLSIFLAVVCSAVCLLYTNTCITYHGLSISIIHRFRLPDQPTYGDGQVLGYKCEQSDPLVCSVVYILGRTAMSSHTFCKCFYIILNVILILMHKNTVHKHNQFMKLQNTKSLVYNWTSLVGCCSIHINED